MGPSSRRCAATLAVLILLAGCGSEAPGATVTPARPPTGASSSAASPARSGSPDLSASPSLAQTTSPTPTASADLSAMAVTGLQSWLVNPVLTFQAGVAGAETVVPLHGLIEVEGPNSYQLLTAESGAIFVYERSLVGGRASRSTGPKYHPAPATLTVAERFRDALASSTGWTDLGMQTRDGLALRHLHAGQGGLSDPGLMIDLLPPDAPTDLRARLVGGLDAWVTADGHPVTLAYTSDSLQLVFRIRPSSGAIANDTEPRVRHTSSRFGYSFDVGPSVMFEAAEQGESETSDTLPGEPRLLTYCTPRTAGGLEAWAGDGITFYTKRWGAPGVVLRTGVMTKALDPSSTNPIVLSTWIDRIESGGPYAVVNAAFATKTSVCDLQSFVPQAFEEVGHARFDRLLITLTVTH
jgi:hypothetical protein